MQNQPPNFGKNEPTIRAEIRTWLIKHGFETEIEYRTRTGPIDIYLTNRRVIIEVKKRGRLDKGPHEPGTGSPGKTREDESAY